MTRGKTFADFLEAIKTFVKELEAHPEDAECIRQKFWSFRVGDVSEVLGEIHTQLAFTIVGITHTSKLSPELKLMVLEQMRYGLHIAVNMLDTSIKPLKKDVAECERIHAEREMRRNIAASIAGMGKHLERRGGK